MEDLIKALGRWVSRDIPYIIGGSSVILSFLYIFDEISVPLDTSIPIVILFFGIAYIVGFTIQETLCFTPIVCSSIVIKPNSFLKWLFKKWTRTEWTVADDFDEYKEYILSYQDMDAKKLTATERILFLKTVGNAMGSNWLVTSVFLEIKNWNHPNAFNMSLAVGVFILSVLLILLGWLQGLQAKKALLTLRASHPLIPTKPYIY